MEFRIGTGGWQYFPVPTADKLKAFSKVFDFVEVNSTFYTHVPFSTVRRWREAVPPEFEFSAKCSREVTSVLRSGDKSGLARHLDYMETVSEILDASVLVLQTPARLNLQRVSLDQLGSLVESVEARGLRLAWEVRSELPLSLLSLFRSHGVVHVPDLSRGTPLIRSDILYTRLFGLGHHNLYRFTDQDLERIEENAKSSGSKKAYFAFHGVAMYADALKFKRAVEASGTPARPDASGNRQGP